MDNDKPNFSFKRLFLSSFIERSQVSGLVQEIKERQSGIKIHELQSYPFLHKLPPLPGFIKYYSREPRSLILPYVADIATSNKDSNYKYVNIDQLYLCDQEYFKLNRCVIDGLAKDNKHRDKPKFNRLSKCKYHYVIYNKCINRRNKTVDNIVYRHESDKLNGIPNEKKLEYLQQLQQMIDGYASSSRSSAEASERFAADRIQKLMADRLNKLRRFQL